MEYIKKYEDMKTIKSSELDDTWDFKRKDINKGKSTEPLVYDKELGEKTIELLKEYNLGILAVGKGKYCTEWNILLEDEKNLIEYIEFN